MAGFVILIVILAVLWALFVMPRRRHQRAHAAMQDSVTIGDAVITAGGLHGEVRALDESTVRLEIAPDVVVTLDRRAIAAVARDVDVEVEEPEPESRNGSGQEPG